ncbi:MBL fold metallo-hydrolase [Poseidonibacter lekithochrous]|uniref:ComEC/Rec2 family competence protein n=1 Tax=Poseidonibacter TaxID=2321187 RepID=UPI001C08FF31|nr:MULTISPECIES: MBL fold metallo-hydrolase [Poseidonibacter]MBU3015201.1 MBL fold metallo-hydrolase [Poseidonibacter lekithochrous]MDO6828499.1 MBL fold metallo-hydrolase [Poseidonibacter sp. 1_MG-2023]
MIKFEFLPAGSGDCIFINFDNTKYILIDGGYVNTYNRILKNKISDLKDKSSFLDLIVVTHIDNDHINGIKKLFGDEYKDIVKKVWFNSGIILNKYFDNNFTSNKLELNKSQNYSEEIGYTEGIKLEDLLDNLNISNKTPIKAMDIVSIDDDLSFNILSPDSDRLRELIEVWNDELEKLEENDSNEVSSYNYNDYDKSIEELVSKNFESDTSITNGSSIAFLMKYKDLKFLFLADAFVDVVVCSLKSFKYSKEKPLKIEFVKVSHHGSKKNINESLLELIDTDTYIISTNGTKHNHPDQEALSRIIMFNKDKSKVTKIYFNYGKDEFFPHIFQQYENDFLIETDENYEVYINKEYNFILYFPKENGVNLDFPI